MAAKYDIFLLAGVFNEARIYLPPIEITDTALCNAVNASDISPAEKVNVLNNIDKLRQELK